MKPRAWMIVVLISVMLASSTRFISFSTPFFCFSSMRRMPSTGDPVTSHSRCFCTANIMMSAPAIIANKIPMMLTMTGANVKQIIARTAITAILVPSSSESDFRFSITTWNHAPSLLIGPRISLSEVVAFHPCSTRPRRQFS